MIKILRVDLFYRKVNMSYYKVSPEEMDRMIFDTQEDKRSEHTQENRQLSDKEKVTLAGTSIKVLSRMLDLCQPEEKDCIHYALETMNTKLALYHPSVKADIAVNTGALKLALMALRRSNKNEIADELEATCKNLE